ncbi:MAG: hypothetical protein ABGX03_04550 [Methylophilaceae bacterium]|jgi:hypothetical protein
MPSPIKLEVAGAVVTVDIELAVRRSRSVGAPSWGAIPILT